MFSGFAHHPHGVAGRAPTAADDGTRGFAVGDTWHSATGLYQAAGVGTGAATWTQLPAPALPGDAVSSGGAPLALYGTRLLRAAYAGNCLDVVRDSDGASQTLGFVNGVVDSATLAGFGAGTICRVSRWYDQSGNGFGAVQNTAANRPVILPSVTAGNAPSIVFDSFALGTRLGNTSTPIFLTLPSGLAFAGGNASAFFVGRSICGASNHTAFSLADTTTAGNEIAYTNGGSAWNAGNLASILSTGVQEPHVAGLVTTQTGTTSWRGEKTATSIYHQADSFAAGYIGKCTVQASAEGGYEMSALIVFPRSLNATDTRTLRQSLIYHGNLVPQLRKRLLFNGDSITFGYGSAYGQNISRKIAALLNQPLSVVNTGVSGNRIVDRINFFLQQATRNAGPSGFTDNVAHEWIGTNDIAAAYTAQKPVSSISRSGGVATVNSTAHGLVANSPVQVFGVTGDTSFNGGWRVASATTNSFTFACPGADGSGTVSGTTVCTGATADSIYGGGAVVTNIQRTSNVVTITTSAAHGCYIGQTVLTAGMGSLNTLGLGTGGATITGIPSATTFTYTLTGADVASTASGGTAQTMLWALVKQLQALGFKTVLGTVIVRTTFAGTVQETLRLACNALIAANAVGADAIADYAGQATLNAAGATANPALFSDGIHPTDGGYALLAPIGAAAVQSRLS